MGVALSRDLISNSDCNVVLGLGRTGVSMLRHLSAQGLPCVGVDSRPEPPGIAQLRAEFPAVDFYLGELPGDVLLGAGRLHVSPGLALDIPEIASAVAAGVPLGGDIDLFCAAAAAPVVGITGSNAKSTVTELVGEMACAARLRVAVGGNLGTPALDLLASDIELYVLELSSFQLERSAELGLAVAALLNLSEDHFDRHGDMETYSAAKQRIFNGARVGIYNRQDARTQVRGDSPPGSISFGLDEPGAGKL